MLATSQQLPLSSTPTSPNFSIASSTRHPSTTSVGGSDSSRPSTPGDVLLEPPPGVTFEAYLKTWRDAQVGRWLQESRCGSHSAAFANNDIRGDLLLELDGLALKEMGITSVGDRIRILSAVKQLRQKTIRSRLSSPAPNQPSLTADPSSLEPSASFPVDVDAPKTNRRLENSRPPPLHLTNTTRSDLPKVERPPESSKLSVTTPRTALQGSAPSVAAHRYQQLPPLPPPPRSQPPLPPASTAVGSSSNPRVGPLAIPTQPHLAGRRTPTQPDSSTSLSSGWSSGLPSRPNPGNVGGKPMNLQFPRSTSPLPQTPVSHMKRNGAGQGTSPSALQSPARQSHERAFSLPGSNLSTPPITRPSTANSNQTHPYATASPNPQSLQPPSHPANQLSPIAESFGAQKATNNAVPSPASSTEYRVGRSPFSASSGRPSTPSQTAPTIEDIRRKTIKFHLPEEGVSCTVNVTDCGDGIKVLEKALKKFSKLGNRLPDAETEYVSIDEQGGLSVEGWGVFLTNNHDDLQARALSEAELLSVCHSEPDHPVRENGLTLRRVFDGKQKRTKQLINIFGEVPHINPKTSPTSPKNPIVFTSAQDEQLDSALKAGDSSKKTKRASSISVLSGLGVPSEHTFDRSSSPVLKDSASLGSTEKPSKPSRLRNFFGPRPPSELITNHLQDFFPFTEKRVLERTARHSMMRQRRESNRDSFMSNAGRASWSRNRESQALLPSRFSTSSFGSGPHTSMSEKHDSNSSPVPSLRTISTTGHEAPLIAPRVSISTEDGQSHELPPEEEKQSDSASIRSSRSLKRLSHLLPPVIFGNEPFSESFGILPGLESSASSQRFSQLAELRSKRDTSDTASMLTVDEITAEVESRRTSMMPGTEVAEDSGARKTDILAIPFPTRDDSSISEDDVSKDENEARKASDDYEEHTELFEDDDDTTEDIDEDDEDAPSKVVTSTGARAIKWIKGALIGKGSFGSVYLAMDSQRGLLMAVKQVELPTGLSQNEERKKSMLTALEREIELLKELQHENIVQYLDSSMDSEFLNIFLEYVPGGSVAALLRSYGAFEESLVSNFVRQILQGLSYLHGRDIIHRDIKGANILVDNKSCVKISDFGISKRVEDNLLTQGRAHRPSLQGSVFWMAPEVVKQTSYTHKADIWSLGCLCVEMLTGEHPWAKLTQMQAIFKIGSSAKPAIPSDVSSDADDFMQKAFNLDYQARPSAADLLLHVWIASSLPHPSKSQLNPPRVLVAS